MIIKNNPTLKEELQKIIDINATNMNVADMLMTAFSYTNIIDPNEIRQYSKEGWDEREAILEALYDFYQLDKNNQDNQKVMDSYILNNLKCLNPKDYLDNPYAKTIGNTGKTKNYDTIDTPKQTALLLNFGRIRVNNEIIYIWLSIDFTYGFHK